MYQHQQHGNTADDPGDRLAEADGQIAKWPHKEQDRDQFAEHFQKTCDDGDPLFADALEDIADHAEHDQRIVKWGVDAQIAAAPVQDGRIVAARDSVDKEAGADPHDNDQKRRPDKSHEDGQARTGADAVHPAGSEVLAGERGHGGRECGHRHHTELSDLAGGDMGGNDIVSQSVDAHLQDHGADIDNGVHQCHGHSHGKHAFQKSCIQRDMPSLRQDLRTEAQDIERAENDGDKLCQKRGVCSSTDSHRESGDEQQIETDIEQGGNDQEDQGDHGIAKSAQNTRNGIVSGGDEQTGRDNDNVGIRLIKQRIRYPQESHKRFHKQAACQCQEGSHSEDQLQGSRNIALHLLVIAGAEGLCDQDGAAGRDADAQGQEQIVDGTDTAHGGQRLIAQDVSHDRGVRQVVDLLEKIADKQRNGKGYDQGKDVSFG